MLMKNNWRAYILLWEEFKEKNVELFEAYWFKTIPQEYFKFEALRMMEPDINDSSNFGNSKAIDLNSQCLDQSNYISTNKSKELKCQELNHLRELAKYEEEVKNQESDINTLKQTIETLQKTTKDEKTENQVKTNEINKSQTKYQNMWEETEKLQLEFNKKFTYNQSLENEMYLMINTFTSNGNYFQLSDNSLSIVLKRFNIDYKITKSGYQVHFDLSKSDDNNAIKILSKLYLPALETVKLTNITTSILISLKLQLHLIINLTMTFKLLKKGKESE